MSRSGERAQQKCKKKKHKTGKKLVSQSRLQTAAYEKSSRADVSSNFYSFVGNYASAPHRLSPQPSRYISIFCSPQSMLDFTHNFSIQFLVWVRNSQPHSRQERLAGSTHLIFACVSWLLLKLLLAEKI